MAEKQKYWTIISAGQSNMDGRVPIAELPAGVSLPLAQCHYCSNLTTSHDQGVFQSGLRQADLSKDRWGFDLVTYDLLLRQTPLTDLYVIKCAEGGTSIDPSGDGDDHWTADVAALSSPRHSLLRQFTQMIQQCQQAMANQLTIKAMLWHQGEADRGSYSAAAAAHYEENLAAVFARCRAVVGNPALPIICGTVSHHSQQYDPQVEHAMIRLAQADPNIHLVDMAAGTLLDPYHFDAASAAFFGKQAFNCLIANGIVSGQPVSVPAVTVY